MDWMLIVPPIIMFGVGYILGRVWSLKEYLELEEKNYHLERDLRRLTTRGPDGRFVRPDK